MYGAGTRVIGSDTQSIMGLCPASPLSGCRYRAGAGAVPAKASGRGQGKGLLLSRLMSSNSSDSDQVKESISFICV